MTPAVTTKKKHSGRRVAFFATLAVLGPGIIAASAGNDAGGISTYSAAGARYGYQMLWMIFVMTFSLALVQEIAARMGAVTGKGFAALIREKFGVRLALFAMVCLLASNAATSCAEFAGVGASLGLFGVSKYIAVPLVALVVWLLVTRGNFGVVEKVLLALSAVFLAYIIAGFMAKPNWGTVIKATFIPQFTWTPAFVSLVIATIGTTIAPWMQFFVQSNMVDKGATVKDLKVQRFDVIGGAVSANVVAWFIIMTTGTVLFPAGIPATTAAQAALALAPLAGRFATILFAVGLFGASMLAAAVLPLTCAYAICEAFGWEAGVSRSWSEAPAFNAIFTFVIAFGASVILIPNVNLVGIMIFSQVINGVLLPFLLIFMMVLVNDKRIMGQYTNGPVLNVIAWVTIVVVLALTVALLVMTLLGMA